VPLALAGWLRYLLAIDDEGKPFSCSSDPMLETLQNQLKAVAFGKPETATEEVLKPILSNKALFAVDLYEAGLAEKVKDCLKRMLAGPGAVRRTLEELV
jgi:fructuronate reductase